MERSYVHGCEMENNICLIYVCVWAGKWSTIIWQKWVRVGCMGCHLCSSYIWLTTPSVALKLTPGSPVRNSLSCRSHFSPYLSWNVWSKSKALRGRQGNRSRESFTALGSRSVVMMFIAVIWYVLSAELIFVCVCVCVEWSPSCFIAVLSFFFLFFI